MSGCSAHGRTCQKRTSTPRCRQVTVRAVGETELAALAGAAGAGKSVAAAQVVTAAQQRQWPVLVVSADRLLDSAITAQLGAELGLPDSPATVLAGVAAGGDALIVIHSAA